jgi:hypothetical protein
MKKFITYSVLLVSVFALNACLKDDGGYSSLALANNLRPTVSWYGSQVNRYSVAIQISAAETLPLKIAIGGGAKSDLSVTFQMDGQAAVDAYNAQLVKEGKAHGDTLANGAIDPAKFTPFILLPSNLYTIPNLTISVPKGKVEAELPVVFNSANMSLTAKYCLPISIVSVSGDPNAVVVSNLKQVLAYVQLKNKYDGLYKMTGTLVDLANSGITAFSPWKTALVTNGASQVILYDNDAGFAIRHLILSGGGLSSYGGFGLTINFDPATNNVTSVSNTLAPQANTREARLDPSGINKWDPATKTLKIKYFMDQPGGGVGLVPRTLFDETYTFTGDR